MLTRFGISVAVAACMFAAAPAFAGGHHDGRTHYGAVIKIGHQGHITYDRGRYSLNGYRGSHYAKDGYRRYLGYWFPHDAFENSSVIIHVGPGYHGGYARKTKPGIYELRD
ncbi:hypothetical protein [Oricola sp.]|uniref:hypothetical protein n=1 Tax=Oricola sp. TaxID=1979950 RepID=UPI003BAA11B6